MKNFKLLFSILCTLLCFGTTQAQWLTNGTTNVYTFDEVGIDVTNPVRQLHIKANADRNIRLEEDGAGTEFIEFGVDNSGDLNIYRDNNVIGLSMLDANGNVGINTSTPGYRLDVNGSFRVRSNNRAEFQGTVDASGTTNTGVIEIANSLRLDGNEIITNTGSTLFLNHDNNGDVRMDNSTLAVDASTNRVGVGITNPQVRLDVNGDITTSSAHRRGKIRLWKESSAADNRVSHAFGTEAFYNTYGPGSAYANSVGHKFYVHGNELAAQIGYGGSDTPAGRQNSRFYGAVQIGSYEEFSDIGFEMMGVNSCFVPTRDCTDDLGVSSNRWRNINYCGSLISTSDRNLKSNIKDMDYGLAEIMEMRPVSYTYKQREDEGTKLGLIAQELQPIVSEIVKSDELVGDENGNKVKKAREHLGVDYTALIPVLIKGMQEQQVLIEEQQARIDQLEAQMSNGAPTQEGTETVPGNDARMNAQPTGKVFQNNPNPFKNATMISYELPEKMTQARLVVTDMLGIQVANYNLAANQKTGQVTVNADDLANGTYVYALIVDGTPVASNKMIVAK